MGAYGFYPTSYRELSDEQLYMLYREPLYNLLSETQKLELLQETVNRDSVALGMVGAPRVCFEHLKPGVYGECSGDVIKVDRDLALHGLVSAKPEKEASETDKPETSKDTSTVLWHHLDDGNIQVLNTVLHENTHALQFQVVDGTVSIQNDALAEEYRANLAAPSMVQTGALFQPGSHYISHLEVPGDELLYYFQPVERDSNLRAELRTEQILHDLIQRNGSEASFEAYWDSVSVNGYEAAEAKATEFFDNPNFIRDVSRVLQNQYRGPYQPVDPATDCAMKKAMAATYRHDLEVRNSEAAAAKAEPSVGPAPGSESPGLDDGLDL